MTPTVKIEAAKKHGELEYRFFYRVQQRLLSYLPPEPRLIDLWLQAAYLDMSDTESDEYSPKGWGVSILSNSVDTAVPVRRGGYFRLPDLPAAYEEDAVILFKEPNKRRKLYIQWALRPEADQRTDYATLNRALDQVRGVQAKIPVFFPSLWEVRREPYDAIKACFLDREGSILVDGQPFADAAIGSCKLLKIGPANAGRGSRIEFSGKLNIVTFIAFDKQLPAG